VTYNLFESGLRNLVAGVDTKVPLANGSYITAVNFDNAASTPPFISVLNDIIKFAPWYSSIHRGNGYKSVFSTNIYEAGREIVMDFVKGDKIRDIVIFTKNTTESINLLAYKLADKSRKSVVLSTFMEHHSNDLPWRNKFIVDYVEVDRYGRLNLDDLEYKLAKYRGRVKLVTVTGASNVTGYINPIHYIAQMAHKYGAKILVDAAQLAAHSPIDMKPSNSPEHIDYLAFSAHKMYAPFGIGVLIGPKDQFEQTEPVYKGGGTARIVTSRIVQWEESPEKDEAGSPNMLGVVALIAAIKNLKAIGLNKIAQHENNLTNYALSELRKIQDIQIYTSYGYEEEKVGIIPFNIKGIYHGITAKILADEDGIAVRNGCFCAQPYVRKLLRLNSREIMYYLNNKGVPLPGMVRISFGLYNDYTEVDRLINALKRICSNKDYYLSKYPLTNCGCGH
jgi:selenocysteine lyase/cysteine desulfurase